ncbi:MAG: lipoprotein [Pseudomonadota bacterium]
MTITTRTLLTLLLSLFVFGCGQSGPLYVAGNPSTVQPVAEEADTEEEEGEESGEDSDQ